MNPENQKMGEAQDFKFKQSLLKAARVLSNPKRNAADENQALEFMRADADSVLLYKHSNFQEDLRPFFEDVIIQNPDLREQLLKIADDFYSLKFE